jgi:hypothetical protein
VLKFTLKVRRCRLTVSKLVLKAPMILTLDATIYMSVLCFKSNDHKPWSEPPFRPTERAQLKRP